jgi:hypothetical protein
MTISGREDERIGVVEVPRGVADVGDRQALPAGGEVGRHGHVSRAWFGCAAAASAG